MAANQDDEHHQDDCTQHGRNVWDVPALQCAEQQYSAEDEQHLDHDMNRHQNLGPGLEQGRKRGGRFCVRMIAQPAHRSLVHARERDIDDGH